MAHLPQQDMVLRLRQLRVRYPGADAATLDGLDLELAAGERLALVGPSGCGKSTVARALLHLLPPGSASSGSIAASRNANRPGMAERASA